MFIPTTSIAFILLSVTLGFCGVRFFKAFQRNRVLQENSRIGFLLALYFFGFAFQTGIILGLGTLLFASSSQGLYFIVLSANIFLSFLAVFSVYIAYYIFHPQASPLPVMISVFSLGFFTVALTIAFHPVPFVTPAIGVDWNMPLPLSLSLFYLLLTSIGVQLYIFTNLFLRATTREIKVLSFLVAALALGSMIDAFLRFVLFHTATADFRTRIYDLVNGLIGLGFIVAIIVTSFIQNRVKAGK